MQFPARFHRTMGKGESNSVVLGRKWCSKLANGIEKILNFCIVTFETLLKVREC
jgi:hypothetical protein